MARSRSWVRPGCRGLDAAFPPGAPPAGPDGLDLSSSASFAAASWPLPGMRSSPVAWSTSLIERLSLAPACGSLFHNKKKRTGGRSESYYYTYMTSQLPGLCKSSDHRNTYGCIHSKYYTGRRYTHHAALSESLNVGLEKKKKKKKTLETVGANPQKGGPMTRRDTSRR